MGVNLNHVLQRMQRCKVT